MVTHTQNWCSAFNSSKVHTHTAVNTNTHVEHWAAIYDALHGEQLGVGALLKGTLVVVLPALDSIPQP